MNKEQYNELNNSYKKTLVFHFGAGAGFFSEYNNMLKAIAYCLIHKIKFILYSADATFTFEKGWTDYFEPFCKEDTSEQHSIFNKRFPQQWYDGNWDYRQTVSFKRWIMGYLATVKNINNSGGGKKYIVSYQPLIKTTPKELVNFKRENRIDYLTFDLWCDFYYNMDLNQNIKIKNVFQGKIKDLIFEIEKMIWKFNDKISFTIDSTIKKLNISDNYNGIHIRRGDKFVEAKLQSIENYFRLIKSNPKAPKDVFILSDDYGVIKEIKNIYGSDYNIFHLVDLNEKGYVNSDFSKIEINQKREQMIRFFSSIELLKKSKMYIGTISANPSQYLNMYLSKNVFHSLD